MLGALASQQKDSHMTILETVFLGIVSGILTTTLLYLFGLLISKHFVPWYQKFTYKGVDISGIWVANLTSTNGVHGSLEMHLFQNAHELKGDMTIVQGRDVDNPTQVTNLAIVGNIWEGFIILNQQSKDRSRLSYSTSLLQVLNGGIRLKGVYCFRSIQTDMIESQDIKWERKAKS